MSHFSKKSIILLFLLNVLTFSHCLDPFTVAALGGAALTAGAAYYYKTNCDYNECCNEKWIKFNYAGLKNQLENNVFGQSLAINILLKTLKGFLETKDPKKPLVMSFHGPTGVGKNFITRMIADNLYKNSTHSKYIHSYLANNHFPFSDKVSEYKKLIRDDVVAYTKLCDRSLFVFDEVHQMPEGVLDAIKPFLDYHNHIDGVDYRKNIFVFLSNSGGNAIEEVVLQAWLDGKDREALTMKDIEPLISRGVLNERGGFLNSQILQNELIDVYIPFFPLEKKHVRKCINAALRERGVKYDKGLVTSIENDIVYYPEGVNIFSKSGCKRIDQKVLAYM